jgi:hypothetical protein
MSPKQSSSPPSPRRRKTDLLSSGSLAVDLYDAITLDREHVCALADMLDAIFSTDFSDVADGNLNFAVAGPGLALVGHTISEKVSAMAAHAKQLLALTNHDKR